MLLRAEGDAHACCSTSVGIDPDQPPCTGTEGARASVTGGKAIAAAAPRLPVAAADHRRARPGARRRAVAADHRAAGGLPGADRPGRRHPAGRPGRRRRRAAGRAPRRPGWRSSRWARCGAKELNYLSDVDVIFAADHPRIAPGRAADRTSPDAGHRHPAGLGADADLRRRGLGGRRRAASGGQGRRAGPDPGRPGELLPAVGAHLGVPGAAEGPAGGRRPGRWVSSSWTSPRPGVWSAAGRESFVDDVQAMRRRVEDNIPERQRDRELKLGAGGLRDVEFAVQLLQLVHGRTDPDLRLPGTLMGLRSLIRGGYVGRTDGAEMAAAYTFLRRAEHRLQLQRLRRTHLLPEDSSDMEWLARSDGYTASGIVQRRRGVPRRTGPARRHGPPAAREAVLPAAAARGRRGRHGRDAAVPGGGPSPAGRPRLPGPGRGAAAPGGADRRGQPAGRHPAHPAAGAARLLLLQPRPRRRPAVLPAGVRGAGRHPLVPAAAARRGVGRAAAGHPARRLPADRQPADQGARGAAAAGRRRRAARARTGNRGRRAAGPIPPGRVGQGGGGRGPVGPPAGDAPAGLRRHARPDLGDQHRPRADQRRRDHASRRGLRRRGQTGHRGPRRLPGPVRGDRHGPARRRRAGLFLRRGRDVRHGAAAGRGRSGRPGRRRTPSPT